MHWGVGAMLLHAPPWISLILTNEHFIFKLTPLSVLLSRAMQRVFVIILTSASSIPYPSIQHLLPCHVTLPTHPNSSRPDQNTLLVFVTFYVTSILTLTPIAQMFLSHPLFVGQRKCVPTLFFANSLSVHLTFKHLWMSLIPQVHTTIFCLLLSWPVPFMPVIVWESWCKVTIILFSIGAKLSNELRLCFATPVPNITFHIIKVIHCTMAPTSSSYSRRLPTLSRCSVSTLLFETITMVFVQHCGCVRMGPTLRVLGLMACFTPSSIVTLEDILLTLEEPHSSQGWGCLRVLFKLLVVGHPQHGRPTFGRIHLSGSNKNSPPSVFEALLYKIFNAPRLHLFFHLHLPPHTSTTALY
jgi:hypothetical protein